MTRTSAYNRPEYGLGVRVKGTAGTQLRAGYLLYYAVGETETSGTIPGDGTTALSAARTSAENANAKSYVVEQCSITNFEFPAGFLENDVIIGVDGYAPVTVVPFSDKDVGGCNIFTNQSITAGDVLGGFPGSWYAVRGGEFGPVLFRATQTVDRSTTAGTVKGVWAPALSPGEYERKHTIIQEDFDDTFSFSTLQGRHYVSTNGSTTTVAFVVQYAQPKWIAFFEASSTGTLVRTAATGGAATATTTATTDDAVVVLYKIASFAAAAGQPLRAECILTPTEHNTDDMNVFFGFIDSAQTISATVPLQAAGAGPPSDYDGACFFKVDGGTVWQAETSNSTSSGTQNTDTDCGAFTTATQYKLLMTFDGTGSGGTWKFYINGTLAHTASTAASNPLTSALLMPVITLKSGSATGTPALLLRRVTIIQAKAASNF